MRRVILVLALSAVAPLFAGCSSSSDKFDFASDCKARMRDADPAGGVGGMDADVRASDFRTDVYVTGTVAARSGPVVDRFHCVYSGDALISDDRKPAPPPVAPAPASAPSAPNAPPPGGAETGPLAP